MCVGVYPNSNGERKGTHVAVVVHLMKGEFDDELKWPFRGQITIRLLSQINMDYKEYTYSFIEIQSDRNTTSSRQLTQEIGRGLCNFISHTELQPQYLKHDCLKLGVHRYLRF
jgi:TNF receptor-associated factor 4